MRDVMIDLETMSSANNAAIVSIGAVFFSEAAQGQCYYSKMNLSLEQMAGAHVDANTIMWWLKQSDEARNAIASGNSGNIPAYVLKELGEWMQSCVPFGIPVRVWGNGATFDNVVLRNCFARHGVDVPWSFRGDRCYRTIKDMFPVEFEFVGTAHNALDDAINQVKRLQKICAEHKIKLG